MRTFKTVLSLLVVLALAACNKPLPADRAAYAGQWSGAQVSLIITQDGMVDYKTVDGGVNKSINAPIKEFSGNDMVVGVGPMSTTFVIASPPHRVGEAWKMTVDGVELTKN
jgi:hypothetical protein